VRLAGPGCHKSNVHEWLYAYQVRAGSRSRTRTIDDAHTCQRQPRRVRGPRRGTTDSVRRLPEWPRPGRLARPVDGRRNCSARHPSIVLRRGEPGWPIHFASNEIRVFTGSCAAILSESLSSTSPIDASILHCLTPAEFSRPVGVALPGDYELVNGLIEAFERGTHGGDQLDLVRFA